jgi:hypothetical protein
VDYSEMTVKALRALLIERDCEAPAKAKKTELVALLESLDDSEPAAVEAALEELPAEPAPQPKALWATVSDEVSAWVDQMAATHNMEESDIVRGMLYCAFGPLRRGGVLRSKRAIDGALRDTGFRQKWL